MDRSNCFLSSSCFRDSSIEEVLGICQKQNIKRVELSAPHPYMEEGQIIALLKSYKQEGFEFLPHNYFPPQSQDFVLNIASGNSRIQELNKNLIEESVRIAQSVEAPFYGVHIGYLADAEAQADGHFQFDTKTLDPKICLDNMARFIDENIKLFDEANVALLLENLFPGRERNFSLGCTMEELRIVMSLVPKQVGMLLDLGHLNIAAHIFGIDCNQLLDDYLSEFGDRLLEVHLSENMGERDEHLVIGEDSWQLKAIGKIEQITSVKRKYCLEARNSDGLESLIKSMDLINSNLEQIELVK